MLLGTVRFQAGANAARAFPSASGCARLADVSRPLPGRATAAEFGTKFDADLAAAYLEDHGIEARVLSDPAALIAPHLVTDRGFRVVVREEILDEAQEILASDHPAEVDELDAAFHMRPFRDRPAWIRRTTAITFIAVAGPAILVALVLLWKLITGIGP